MRLIFDRSNMTSTGWKLTKTPSGMFAECEDREGGIALLLRETEGKLDFTLPDPESSSDGKFLAHLFDVLHENNTRYTIA